MRNHLILWTRTLIGLLCFCVGSVAAATQRLVYVDDTEAKERRSVGELLSQESAEATVNSAPTKPQSKCTSIGRSDYDTSLEDAPATQSQSLQRSEMEPVTGANTNMTDPAIAECRKHGSRATVKPNKLPDFVNACRQAVKADPSSPGLRYFLGESLLQSKEYSQAVPHLKFAVDNGMAQASVSLGAAMLARGGDLSSREKAIALLVAASRAGEPGASYTLGILYMRTTLVDGSPPVVRQDLSLARVNLQLAWRQARKGDPIVMHKAKEALKELDQLEARQERLR